MQRTARYLDRRVYIELVLVLAVALVAASVGRWVIPSGGPDGSASLAASHANVVPAPAGSGPANHLALGTSFEDMHPERSWIIQEAR